MRFLGNRKRNRELVKDPNIVYDISRVTINDGPRDSPCIDIDIDADAQGEEEGDGPPYIVVVQGPPKVGKTLLIKSLVQFYSKGKGEDDSSSSNMWSGPIIIAGRRRRRIQFVECPNNVNGMIDASKYADAVIFLIDACGHYQFEMETFEFLELAKVHGMPKVIGVLTYLDILKNACSHEYVQEYLMENFQTRICKGAKLFCLSGLDNDNVGNKRYLEHEIEQLATHISTMEFHPLSWRAAALGGPFMLVDHVTPLGSSGTAEVYMDDNDDDDDTKCHRGGVIFQGYLRGHHIKEGTMLHIAGVGDFRLTRVTTLADPFPADTHLSESTSCLQNGAAAAAGAYVSFEVHDVPFEIVENHDPCRRPLLIGGITTEEVKVEEKEDVGYIQVKLERHNWHLKLLRSEDPFIVSVGWRRYETRPIYALKKDSHGRYRYRRRTPPNTPCFAMFWGPLPPPNTQLAVLQSLADKKAAFRFLAKGIVVDVNQAAQIVKKSKRIGSPCKISGKNALVKDMFTSDLEIADFKDAKIQTDSGNDGKIVENAVGGDVIGEGVAKCTFNHKIRKCDTILMNVYEQVVIPRLFNPRTIGPDPPDRIWVGGVPTCRAGSFVPVVPKRHRLNLEDIKLFTKRRRIHCSYRLASESEKHKWKQQLDEVELEYQEWKKKLEEELKAVPRPRRDTLEQLRAVRFNKPAVVLWI
ncbi:hypothetical protein V2J09_007505 [Rumex salicifolius]